MEPEDKDGFQDEDGCPEPDNDGDGIPDAADKCPNEPEDKDGFQDEDGCPDPTTTATASSTRRTSAPTEPETKNGFQDEDGCPDEIPAKLKKFTGVIQGINFKVGDGDAPADVEQDARQGGRGAQGVPGPQLEIQGHTDDQPLKNGREVPRQQGALAGARRDGEGVLRRQGHRGRSPDRDRLRRRRSRSRRPTGLKGGKLNAARAKNRRVEFKLVSSLTGAAPAAAPAPAPTE